MIPDEREFLTPVAIARVCHEANRAYGLALGDRSQVPWDEAPEWQRRSVLDGVEFHLANPTAWWDASHRNWMALKEAEGWTYGPEKDPAKKTHPCLLPYMALPPQQRLKDKLFTEIVRALRPYLKEEEE